MPLGERDPYPTWMNTKTKYAFIPLAIAAIALCVGLVSNSAIVFSVCFAVLVFDVPVCLLVGWEWIRTGEAPELCLSPLIPSRAERELSRNLKCRLKMSDNDFYKTFYENSPIPETITTTLRRILTEELFTDLAGLHPHDDFGPLTYDLDTAPIVRRIAREFGVKFTHAQIETCATTFDALAQLIHSSSEGRVAVK